jgi:hypothetical protein
LTRYVEKNINIYAFGIIEDDVFVDILGQTLQQQQHQSLFPKQVEVG